GMGKGLIDLQTRMPRAAATHAVIGYITYGVSITSLLLGLGFAYMFLESLVQDPWSRIGMLVLAITLLAINGLFYHLMKAPTVRGRKLLD
ncbi:MAG: hypothetical protein GTN90_07345, partial [Xanthomonadales bacterium]|nr:hypothetical protein [Xanthomonadales bacterium]